MEKETDLKAGFVEFLLETGCLRFGDFVLKSGRRSPYFINIGLVGSGRDLLRLGEFFARAVMKRLGEEFDLFFGPAYKGIPLAAAVSMSYYKLYGLERCFCFNRKERKDHAEGGVLVGAGICEGDRVIVLDDVFTTGRAKIESFQVLREHGKIVPKAVFVAVDRCERAESGRMLSREFQERHGIPVYAIVTTREIMHLLLCEDVQRPEGIDRETVRDILKGLGGE
jgi:orotate phosphoribosyltransferase